MQLKEMAAGISEIMSENGKENLAISLINGVMKANGNLSAANGGGGCLKIINAISVAANGWRRRQARSQ